MARGRGRFSIDRIPYVIEQALPILKDFKHIVLVEANDPVAFFAYPNKPSMLKPEGCDVHRMTSWGENSVAALDALAGAVGAKPADAKPQKLVELAKPTGALTYASIAQAIAMAIPENAIVVDESITTGRGFFPPTAAAAPHDWLQNMGGSIGFSTPVATGAAVACPDRKVICMVGDGSAMYTHPVAVDPGPRGPQRHHHRVRQPHLPDPARRIRRRRRWRARAARDGHAENRSAGHRLRLARQAAWAFRAGR